MTRPKIDPPQSREVGRVGGRVGSWVGLVGWGWDSRRCAAGGADTPPARRRAAPEPGGWAGRWAGRVVGRLGRVVRLGLGFLPPWGLRRILPLLPQKQKSAACRRRRLFAFAAIKRARYDASPDWRENPPQSKIEHTCQKLTSAFFPCLVNCPRPAN